METPKQFPGDPVLQNDSFVDTLCQLGLTGTTIADLCGVTKGAVSRWRHNDRSMSTGMKELLLLKCILHAGGRLSAHGARVDKEKLEKLTKLMETLDLTLTLFDATNPEDPTC